MNVRKATVNDIDSLLDLRKKQLVDEGIAPSMDIDSELKDFFFNKLEDGSLIQWVVVEDEEEVIATGGILFYDFPPSYTNQSGKKAYITNMYTKDSHRGKGIAKELLTKLVNEAKEAGISTIWLAASKMGKPVYKKFGFQEIHDWLELHIQ